MSIPIDQIPAELGLPQAWEQEGACRRLVAPGLNVRQMAEYMLKLSARFVTITARPAPGGECRLDYHWDLDGQLLTFVTATHEGSIATISAICPGADWVEREVRDYFAVDFLGRESTDPLMLRPQDAPGVFRRPDDTGQGG